MKTVTLVLIAILLGGLAAYYVVRSSGAGNGNEETIGVVVSSSTLDAGTKLDAQNLRIVRWPKGVLPEGTFDNIAIVEGRVIRVSLQAGEPLLESKLAPTDSSGGLSSVITVGKRAISVRVNDVIGVAGFALPGSYVDVVVSASDAAGQAFSKIVLSRVKVLAIAQDTTADPTKPKVVNAVTLELTPEESEKLDLARSIGSLSLVLRNELDLDSVFSEGARLQDLVGSSAPAPAPESAQPAVPPTEKPAPKAEPRPARPPPVDELRGTTRSPRTQE